MTDAPATSTPDGYDFSGLPATGRDRTAGTASVGMRALAMIGLVAGGLVVAVAGALVAAVGDHEVAKATASAADVSLSAPATASTVDLFVAQIGRAMEIFGGVLAAAGFTLMALALVRPVVAEAAAGTDRDESPPVSG